MPSLLGKILNAAIADLMQAEARFAVVGGLAVSARAVLRYTRDVDLAVAVPDDQEAERIAGVMVRYGYRPIMELDNTAVNRMSTLRLVSPHAPRALEAADIPLLDILFASCGIEEEVVQSATPLVILNEFTLPTARIEHLIAMKLVSESDSRLQDRVDLQKLILTATDEDLEAVPHLLKLITERGYARDKDLFALFEQFRKVVER